MARGRHEMRKIPLLLTRPEGRNSAFADRLPTPLREVIEPIEAPLLRILPVTPEAAMQETEEAIFTSASALDFAPAARGRRAYCVGDRTTEAARAAGWQAICAGPDAGALVQHLLAQPPGAPLCHLAGTHVRGGVVETLREAGRPARRIVLYDQHLVALPDGVRGLLASGARVLVPLFSPRAAAHFRRQCPAGAQPVLIALSPAVAAAATGIPGAETVTARTPDANALIDCLEKLLPDLRLG